MNRVSLLVSLVVLGASGLLYGDTVVLKSGAVYHGVVRNPESDPVYVQLSKGNKIGFDRKYIEDILLDQKRYDASELHINHETNVDNTGNEGPVPPLDAKQRIRFQRLLDELAAATPADLGTDVTPERGRIIRSMGSMGIAVAPHIEKIIRKDETDDTPYLLLALDTASPKRCGPIAQDLALSAASETTRKVAVEIVSKANTKNGAKVLERALSDSQGDVRCAAVKGLGATNDPAHLPALVNVLDDPTPDVQDAAREALAKISGQSFRTTEEWNAWLEAAASEQEDALAETEQGAESAAD